MIMSGVQPSSIQVGLGGQAAGHHVPTIRIGRVAGRDRVVSEHEVEHHCQSTRLNTIIRAIGCLFYAQSNRINTVSKAIC